MHIFNIIPNLKPLTTTMKKNRKKYNLNELASMMTLVDSQEQRSSSGGAFCFREDGTFIGQIGSSSEIRIVDDRIPSFMYTDDYSVQLHSHSLSMASDMQKASVVKSIGEMLGVNVSMGVLGPDGYGSTLYGDIQFNITAKSFDIGNFYDFYLTIEHEQFHAQQRNDPSFNGFTNMHELEAILHTRSHDYFAFASQDYQDMIIKNANYYANI